MLQRTSQLPSLDDQSHDDVRSSRKPYSKPLILHELRLETQAGSTIGPMSDPLDPLNSLRQFDPRPKFKI